jgi:hypothetical protein
MVVVVFKFCEYNAEHTHKNGFGDMVRGLISVKQIQQMLGFKLLVDMKGYFAGKFFKDHCPIMYEHYTIFKLYGNEQNNLLHIRDIIQNEFDKGLNIIAFNTNHYPVLHLFNDEEKKQDMIDFMREVFTFTPEFERYFNERCEKLGNDYHLFHYRLGDKVMNECERVKNLGFCVNHLLNYKKENSVLISDSLEFKEKIAGIKSDIKVFLNKPVHSNSFMVDNKTKTDENFVDIMIDFFLIKNAKSLTSYSVYDWTSNFVFWTSMIYGVPLTVLPKSHYIVNI